MECMNCKYEVAESYNYCPNCGSPINENDGLVEKLIRIIDYSICSDIQVEELIVKEFVPINIKDKCLFVVTNSRGNKDAIANYLNEKFSYSVKFIELPQYDWAKLLINIVLKLDKNKK